MARRDYALRFISIGSFERRWEELGLDDEDLRSLEIAIQADPEHPPIVRGTGGLRKIRFAAPGSVRGKSGSFRVGFAHFRSRGIILLLDVWSKKEKGSLSQAERNSIADALARFEKLIKTGKIQ
jgi:hypothetical protein